MMCQTFDRECLSLSAVERDSAQFFSRLFVPSFKDALFEGQWSALPTSAHSRGDGSLTGQGSDSVVAESREQVVVLWCRACKHYTCAARKLDLRPNERLLEGQSGDM